MPRVVDANRSGRNKAGPTLPLTKLTACNIVPDLEHLAFPVEKLTTGASAERVGSFTLAGSGTFGRPRGTSAPGCADGLVFRGLTFCCLVDVPTYVVNG
jgi:hypothetical protein